MTEHSHVRDADINVVDAATCVHRLLPPGCPPSRTYLGAQCPRQPEVVVAGLPCCSVHLAWVVGYEHGRGNPDVVVRRWV